MISANNFYIAVRPYLRDDLENPASLCNEIHESFVRMTRQHIARVNTIASFYDDGYYFPIGTYFPHHDVDKFNSPFYHFVQWKHLGNNLSEIVKDVDEVNKLISDATFRHIISKPHHPECWDKNLENESFDRDNPKKDIDATLMNERAMVEYVCDCAAMSVQIQEDINAVFEWFDDNIDIKPGKRWMMSQDQIDYIYSVASAIITNIRDKTRYVFFDVDGVLRDIGAYFGVSDADWDVKVGGKSIYEKITEDFACLEKMPSTMYMPVVQKFTRNPNIISTQIEPEAREATTKWLKRYFDSPNIIYVGAGSSQEKNRIVTGNSRIFDDHPMFPESSRLITVGYHYNSAKCGFHVNTPAEMEAVLEVLKPW